MRSLDPVNTATTHQHAPRATMAPRAPSGKAATGFRFSSSSVAATHAARTANGAMEQVKPPAEEARARPASFSVVSDVPSAVVTAASSSVAALAVEKVADNARGLAGSLVAGNRGRIFSRSALSMPACEKETAAVAEGDHEVRGFCDDKVGESGTCNGAAIEADQGAEQAEINPFVGSQKLARTPPTAAASSAEVIIPGIAAPRVSKDANAFASSGPLEATLAAPPGTGDGRGGQESPEPIVAEDPFATKSKVPRTPVDKAAASQSSLELHTRQREGGGGGAAVACEGGESAGAGAGRGEGEESAARMHIGELRQEVASLADRLAKQANERNRLEMYAAVGLGG